MKININNTPEARAQMAWDLFKIHTHAEIANDENPDQIVYKEADIIELLASYGLAKPDYDSPEYAQISMKGMRKK